MAADSVKAQPGLAVGDELLARWRKLHAAFATLLAQGQGMRVGESRGNSHDSRGVEERLLQAIWHDQSLRTEAMATASGKRVEVLEPGRWNTGPGPDFLDAKVRLAGIEHSGDVEIHVSSADWARHRHHQDFAYNRVVLHVVLNGSDDRPHEEKHNGERLERLIIEPYLEPDLETLRRTINLDDYPYGAPDDLGICHTEFLRLPEEQLVDFLITSGRARVEDRIRRFAAQISGAGDFTQLLYQAILVAQGHKANKTLYFLLSRRAPLREFADLAPDVSLAERTDLILSVLLHVAQILPPRAELSPEADEDTVAFADRMDRLWSGARPYFADRYLPPTKRWHSGVRPAGFPARRLTAVAIIADRLVDRANPLFEKFCARVSNASLELMKPAEQRAYWKSLAEPLMVEDSAHYFARHFTLGGKEQKPQALLGEAAARSLAFNALLPLAILKARMTKNPELERAAWLHIGRFPALEENAVARFMKRRLLGDAAAPAGLFSLEIGQQSLLKVFADCCSHNERSCANCTLLALGRQSVT